MNAYVASVIENVKKKHGNEPEFVQTVEEVLTSIAPMIDKHPEYEKADLLNRIVEPERMFTFRVVWMDDNGNYHTNIGYRWALYVALFGGGVFGVIQAIPGDITPFVIWRFVGGIFFAGIFPAINALLAENTLPNERGRVYGLSYAAQQIGSVCGPIFGGLMATYWTNAIVVMAHGFVMILLVILLYLKRPKNQDPGSGETIEVEENQTQPAKPLGESTK